ncbi:MAG: sigma-70 family RNA polymerase sigma factor [Solirubrobacteraceae bacterium]
MRFAPDDRLVSLVRRGDSSAFEILYDRHAGELLSFCRYMLGSRHDAEDAVQGTFVAAHRALLADERAVTVRPWLFAIARNSCLTILRQRRPEAGLEGAFDHYEDPVARLEQREDLRQVVETMLELPERQRAALVLAEIHGLSQTEIAELMGVRAEQVKAYVFQARSSLLSERRARSTDCQEIREELAVARGAGLLKSNLRRHLRSCPGCRDYSLELAQQRRQLGALLPLVPSLAFKHRALEAAQGRAHGAGLHACGQGGVSAGAGSSFAGAGLKAFAVKLLAGVACIGAAGAGVHILDVAPGNAARSGGKIGASKAQPLQLAAAVGPTTTSARAGGKSGARTAAVPPSGSPPSRQVSLTGASPSTPAVSSTSESAPVVLQPARPTSSDRSAVFVSKPVKSEEAQHGKSEEPHGKSEEPQHGKSEEPHGKSEEAHEGHATTEEVPAIAPSNNGKSEEAHGKSEEQAHRAEPTAGKSEEAHGKGH